MHSVDPKDALTCNGPIWSVPSSKLTFAPLFINSFSTSECPDPEHMWMGDIPLYSSELISEELKSSNKRTHSTCPWEMAQINAFLVSSCVFGFVNNSCKH